MRTPFKHPLATYAAGSILGRRRNGSPIYAIAGGNGEGEGGSGAPAGGEGGTPLVTPPVTPAATPPAGEDSAATIARLEKELKAANGEAAKARTNAKQQAADDAVKQLTQQLGKALGLVKDDAPADPAELTQKLTAAQADARTTAVELAVYKAAGAAQADPDALLDSRTFVASLADVDPKDSKAIAAAIATAIKDNPKLKAAQAAGRSGADIPGGPGATRTRSGSLGAALKGHYGT